MSRGIPALPKRDDFSLPWRHTNMTSMTQDPNTQLDRRSFTISVQRYRRELHVHCY
jgi:hypothetical protein